MFSASYFLFSCQPVSSPIFPHLWIWATPRIRVPRTAGRGTIEESSSEREQLLKKRLRKYLRNLDLDLARGKNEASGMSVKEEWKIKGGEEEVYYIMEHHKLDRID